MKIQIKVSTEFILDAQTYSGDGKKKKKSWKPNLWDSSASNQE